MSPHIRPNARSGPNEMTLAAPQSEPIPYEPILMVVDQPGNLPSDILSSPQSPHTPNHDRRQSPRQDGAPGAVEACVIGSSLPRVRTLVCDQSGTGLSILLPAPVAVGGMVAIWPAGYPGEAAVVEVRHCRIKDENWQVGCAFLGPPLVCHPVSEAGHETVIDSASWTSETTMFG